MWSFKLLISVYTSGLSELFDSALCVCVSLSALPCRGECVRNRLLMLSVFICVIGHFWLSSCLRVHFCAGIQFSFFPVCVTQSCPLFQLCMHPSLFVSLTCLWVFACTYLCMRTLAGSLSSFPPWPLSPDVSAWERRWTMVTKSQRAIAWGGATPVCRLTGLSLTHTFITSACHWAGAASVSGVFSHRRKLLWKIATKCTGGECWDRKWELRLRGAVVVASAALIWGTGRGAAV